MIKELQKQTTNAVPLTYVQRATSDNTRAAYQRDIRHFECWGGQLPADTASIIRYLHEHATILNPRTLQRRITALRLFHTSQGFIDPTSHPLISKTLQGIQKTHGRPRVQAPALRLEQLQQAIDWLQIEESWVSCRNQCLLVLGFYGALRGSELVTIHVEHVHFLEQGLRISIPQSKTDQIGQGHQVFLPAIGAKSRTCPIALTRQWLDLSQIQTGALFPSTKQGQTDRTVVMTKSGLNSVLKTIAKACGWTQPQAYSSHSLRRGLATSASAAGASVKSIMKQGRWQSEKTVLQYVEEGQAFDDNAVNVFFKT